MSRSNVLILLLLSLQVFVACFEQQHHNCIHDVLVAEEAKLGKRTQKHVNVPRQNTKAPIRMRIDTSSFDLDPAICRSVGQVVLTDSIGTQYRCTANDIMTPEKEAFLENRIIPESIAKFASLLNVLSVSGPLTLYDDSCGCGGRQPAKVNATYQTAGVEDTDIVLFMTARPTFNGTIAWACPCMFEGTGRPIAGFINWGPNAIDQTAISYPGQFGVGIHEITHALGFTSGSYANYASGPNIVQTVTRTDDGLSHNVSIIGTPKVQQAIRDHFNCPTMDGMELENGGGSGTAGSHWEKRLASNEYMTGTSSFDPVFSPITLALLEDSGWYFPNYTNASPLLWGKNAGCNFVNLRCDDWPRPYSCDANLMNADIDCTYDYRKKGVCNIRNATNIPTDPWYSYYPNKRAFGSDMYSDYCGFIASQKTWDCTVPENSNITFSRQAYGERYCPTCRCMRTMNKDKLRTPSCQNFTCVGPTLKVQIGYVWYDCDANDKQITITSGYDGGYYVCPPDAVAQCQGVPIDPNNVWPSFVSVNPTSGAPGTNVTITVNNLLDVANVAFGPQHGCYEPSRTTVVSGTQTIITCLIGQLKSAVIILEENKEVDVTVVDSQGRSATGFKAYRLNTSDAGMMGWNGWMIVMALLGFAIKM